MSANIHDCFEEKKPTEKSSNIRTSIVEKQVMVLARNNSDSRDVESLVPPEPAGIFRNHPKS